MGRLSVVVGGQFGSEGKGAVVAHLARHLRKTDTNIRVAGPNAGHTVYDQRGRVFRLRQVPAAAPLSTCQLGIAAGSEIDLAVLAAEVRDLEVAGYPIGNRMRIHPAATVIESEDLQHEKDAGLVGRIGSTGKGIGAARSRRIMREAHTIAEMRVDLEQAMKGAGVQHPPVLGLLPGTDELPDYRKGDLRIVVEGTQGYGLGLHTGFYPKTTSSDCRAVDFLSMAGISPWSGWARAFEVWVVMRTYPIRVAGDSGPLHWETTWQELGLDPELTTVTQKVRRVGRWDPVLARDAVAANGGPPTVKIALTMLDHMFPELKGATFYGDIRAHPRAYQFIRQVEEQAGAPVRLVGTGPTTMVPMPWHLSADRFGLQDTYLSEVER